MPVLSSSSVLDLWDRGSQLHSLDQGLLALSVGFPETSYQTLADWPLGRRNRALAELRSSWFGPHLEGLGILPAVRRKTGVPTGRPVLHRDRHSGSGADCGERTLLSSPHQPRSGPRGRRKRPSVGGAAPSGILPPAKRARPLSDDDLEAVGEKMAAADPLAETRLSLVCPNCGNQWEDTVDIAAFLGRTSTRERDGCCARSTRSGPLMGGRKGRFSR